MPKWPAQRSPAPLLTRKAAQSPARKSLSKNGATGIATDTTTNATGNYNIVNLIPAEYSVSVTATGFNTTTTKVTLTVGAQQELSLSLKVGEMSQLVEVTGAAPVIETENATLSGNVQSAQIVEFPSTAATGLPLPCSSPASSRFARTNKLRSPAVTCAAWETR